MAVYAAHLTRTLQGTPTIFQVTAQEALGSTVKPALKKVVEYLAAVYPNKCGWALNWYDELYLVFDCCLQYHYLKHYAASFSESFYGLLRVPISVSNEFSSGQRLPDLLEKGSLAMLVLVPYLSDKLEKIVDKWREDDEDGRLGKSNSDRARRAAIRIYNITYLVARLSRFIQLAAFLTGRSQSPSLSHAALRLSLTYAPPYEEQSWSDYMSSGEISFPMVGGLLLRGAEYGAFLVQLLRWWEAKATTQHLAAPTPPPPPPRDDRALRWKNKCPICLQSWKIPTVLPVSGYIFCYVCISRHVRANNCCPLTRCPALESSLVRLYVD